MFCPWGPLGHRSQFSDTLKGLSWSNNFHIYWGSGICCHSFAGPARFWANLSPRLWVAPSHSLSKWPHRSCLPKPCSNSSAGIWFYTLKSSWRQLALMTHAFCMLMETASCGHSQSWLPVSLLGEATAAHNAQQVPVTAAQAVKEGVKQSLWCEAALGSTGQLVSTYTPRSHRHQQPLLCIHPLPWWIALGFCWDNWLISNK